MSHRFKLLALLMLLLPAQVGAQPNDARTMLIVAHQDDDLLILYPDLAQRMNRTTPMQTVYLTNGNAGLDCNEYTKGREEGIKKVHALLVGVDDKWRDEERTINGKLLRFSTLVGTQHSLVFVGFANSPEKKTSLEYLWSTPGVHLTNLAVDGRSRVDSFSADELIETLRTLMQELKAEDVRMLDASQRQPEFYPFDHTDHVHSALFGFAALQRYGKTSSFTMYRGYNIQLEKKNLAADVVAKRESLFRLYAEHDKKICDTGKVTLCGKTTRCFPMGIFLPFQSRRYTIEQLTRRDSTIRTQFGRCLDSAEQAGEQRVTTQRCDETRKSQRWSIDAQGQLRQLESGRCLTANSPKQGGSLSLSDCTGHVLQRFFMTSQGQLRGPDATCVRSGLRDPELEVCALRRMRQAGWRVEDELPASEP